MFDLVCDVDTVAGKINTSDQDWTCFTTSVATLSVATLSVAWFTLRSIEVCVDK